MIISNNENNDTIPTPKSRKSSRLRPKPLSDITNIQTTLPEAEAEPKIEQESGKEDLAPCRPDKFVFFPNLKFIPESEEVASTSGQDNNKKIDFMELEDPLWLVNAVEQYKEENDLDASSQSCPITYMKRSRKNTRYITHKQKMHGTFPLPDIKTKKLKRKRNLASPVKISEPLHPEISTKKQLSGASVKQEEPLHSSASVKKRLFASFTEHKGIKHSKASLETQSSKAPKKHEEPFISEASVEKNPSKAPVEHDEPSSSSSFNTDTPIILQVPEYVEEQKAYFSQIDAFELEEESQSSDNSESSDDDDQ